LAFVFDGCANWDPEARIKVREEGFFGEDGLGVLIWVNEQCCGRMQLELWGAGLCEQSLQVMQFN
jgi:hypothetical protein